MTQLTASVGSPRTVSIASGGYTYAFNNISTAPRQVLGANPARQRIVVHNPGDVDQFFYPITVQNTGSDVALTPSPALLGGCYRVYGNGGTLILEGEVQKAWGAFAFSGTTNPLTITDSSV